MRKSYNKFIFIKTSEIDNEKNYQKRRAFSQANHQAIAINNPSKVLYVGSSSGFESRLRQHFGYKDKRTYSMQLKHWLDISDAEIIIDAWYFDGLEQKYIQEVENHLWMKLKPMLGKYGGK